MKGGKYVITKKSNFIECYYSALLNLHKTHSAGFYTIKDMKSASGFSNVCYDE